MVPVRFGRKILVLFLQYVYHASYMTYAIVEHFLPYPPFHLVSGEEGRIVVRGESRIDYCPTASVFVAGPLDVFRPLTINRFRSLVHVAGPILIVFVV